MQEEPKEKQPKGNKWLNLLLLFGPLVTYFLLPFSGAFELFNFFSSNVVHFLMTSYFVQPIPLVAFIALTKSPRYKQAAAFYLIGWALPVIAFFIGVFFFMEPS